jgi:hypothetical protein
MNRNTSRRNITAQEQEYFRQGIRRFYENCPGSTLRQAYERTLVKFFRLGCEQQGDLLVPILPPLTELPTYNQFYYFYRKECNLRRELQPKRLERSFKNTSDKSAENNTPCELPSGTTGPHGYPLWNWAVQQHQHSCDPSTDVVVLKYQEILVTSQDGRARYVKFTTESVKTIKSRRQKRNYEQE